MSASSAAFVAGVDRDEDLAAAGPPDEGLPPAQRLCPDISVAMIMKEHVLVGMAPVDETAPVSCSACVQPARAQAAESVARARSRMTARRMMGGRGSFGSPA